MNILSQENGHDGNPGKLNGCILTENKNALLGF